VGTTIQTSLTSIWRRVRAVTTGDPICAGYQPLIRCVLVPLKCALEVSIIDMMNLLDKVGGQSENGFHIFIRFVTRCTPSW
jgi:hypothetical protein